MARIRSARTLEELATAFSGRAFTLDEALVHGISRSRIFDAVNAGAVTRLRPGLFLVPGEAPGDPVTARNELVLAAARLATQRGILAAAGNETAAAIWGLPSAGGTTASLYGGAREGATILVANGPGLKFGKRTGLRVRRLNQLPEHHVTSGPEGLPVTTPIRTGIDLARSLPHSIAHIPLAMSMRLRAIHMETATLRPLSAYDAADVTEITRNPALRLRVHEELRETLRELSGSPGIRNVLRTSAESPEITTESPLEALSWGRFVRSSLPLPRPQQWITDGDGRLRRVDFLWEAERVIGEADGLIKYVESSSLREEKLRQEAIEREGFTFVRWTWRDMYESPDRLLARIDAALQRCRR